MTMWALGALQSTGLRDRYVRYAGGAGVATRPVGSLGGPFRLPKGLQAFLLRAGAEWTPAQAFAVLAAHALGGALAGHYLHVSMLGAALGVLLLYIRLRMRQGQRVTKMAEQLPDTLMLLATSIRAGLGFQQALQMVADEGPQPLAPELGRLGTDLALGLNLEEALSRLQTRLGSTDAEMFASALLVQRQTGGNLSEILVNLHDTIRDRQEVLGQVRTLTAMGRISGLILSALPFVIGLAVYVLNRNYMMILFTDPRGQMMAAGSLVAMVVGALMIRKMTQITL
jgi:tight adherence protein B